MSAIRVKTESLEQISSRLTSAMNEISDINNDFYTTYKQIDWDVKTEITLLSVMQKLRDGLDKVENDLYKHKEFLMNAVDRYNEAEGLSKSTEELNNNLYSGGDVSGNNKENGEQSSQNSNDFMSALEKFFKEMAGKSFSEILKEYGKYCVGFAFSSAIVSGYMSLMKFYDKYKNGVNSKGVMIIDGIKTGLGMFKNWTKCVFEFDKFIKASKGIKAWTKEALKSHPLQKFCKFIPVINVPISFASTAIESYNEYAADGEFSDIDFASTVIDSSVSGLFSVASGLIGMAQGVAAAVSGVAFDSAKSGFKLDKKVSTAIKDWAYNAGRKLKSEKSAGNKLTPETAVYSAFYGIGWGATKIKDGAVNAFNSIKSIFT